MLEPKHLLLASHKTDPRYAGCHGEGFKVAINFLLGRGFAVKYAMDRQDWEFKHRQLHAGAALSMVVVMLHAAASLDESLIITLTGKGAGGLFDPDVDWTLFRARKLAAADPDALRDFSLCVHGQELVLTRAVGAAGRTYNRGLYVSMSDELAALGVCGNFGFDLHRDRHALPANLPFKVGDVLQQAFSVHGLEAPRVAAMCDALIERLRGGGRGAEWLAGALRDHLRVFLANRLGVLAADVVFLASGDSSAASLLHAVGLSPIPDAGALAESTGVNGLILGRLRGLPEYGVALPGRGRTLGLAAQVCARTAADCGVPRLYGDHCREGGQRAPLHAGHPGVALHRVVAVRE